MNANTWSCSVAKSKRQQEPEPIGDRLRRQRIEVLKKSLRQTASDLSIAPAHLTDIEKGRRSPSEELLLRIARIYRLDEQTLRKAWGKMNAVVGEVFAESETTAAKVPEFLRTARELSANQWDELIRQAKSMSSKRREDGPR